MRIDQSRFKEFWRSPERYRLIYELNLVPAVPNYSLQRGIAFHTIADLAARGESEEAIAAILSGQKCGARGEMLNLSKRAVEVAWALWRYQRENGEFTKSRVVATELEFEFDVFDSPHTGVGRLDRLIEHEGRLWILEYKTTGPRKRLDSAIADWEHDKQADFMLLGARALGYDVHGVIVSYVVESTPPSLLPPIHITRTDAALARTKLEIHQTCEIIELLRRICGTNTPWPHLACWPCIRRGECEYETICGQQGDFAELPEGFRRREEHLVLLQEGDKCV